MIASKTNELIKHIKSLHQKKFRDEYREYFVEGVKLINEAIFEGKKLQKILICEELLREDFSTSDNEILEYVTKNVFEYVSDTQSPQGILAVIKMDDADDTIKENVIFALDDLQDPGNLGTILRSLDSAGIDTLLLSKGTVDLYNPKVIRSTMGAIFRVKVLENLDLKEKLLQLKDDGYKVVITSLDTNETHYNLDFKEKLVIVIGNEAKGVKKEIQDLADIKVKIPMLGRTESLNASVAASIIAYEKVRQEFKNEN